MLIKLQCRENGGAWSSRRRKGEASVVRLELSRPHALLEQGRIMRDVDGSTNASEVLCHGRQAVLHCGSGKGAERTNSRPRPSRLLIPALTSNKQPQLCGQTKGRRQKMIKSSITKKVNGRRTRCLPWIGDSSRYRSLFPSVWARKTWPAVNQGASACSKRERNTSLLYWAMNLYWVRPTWQWPRFIASPPKRHD
jgi:hypothetical protein